MLTCGEEDLEFLAYLELQNWAFCRCRGSQSRR
jgi:hypothetical protein